MASLSTPLLVIVFLAGAAATWVAGIRLSGTTDALDARFGLGEELGGILLLAVAGTFPSWRSRSRARRGGTSTLRPET